MKINGRNIKRRLYGLSNIPSNIKRVRYWRGHGVHSPFVYSIVRQVFMASEIVGEQRDLYHALIEKRVAKRRAIELQNLMTHCGYESFSIDKSENGEKCDMIITTLSIPTEQLRAFAERAAQDKTTLAIISPYYDKERAEMCKEIVETHRCTSVDNRAYLLLFNNHLPKQKFRL